MNLYTLAERFSHAFYNHTWEGGDDLDLTALSLRDAYEVQRLVAENRTLGGEKVVGYKVGCTSAAIQSQFGLSEPICGRLFSPHVQEEGVCLNWSSYTNCAIEPEMVIRIGRDIPRGDLSDDELVASIDYVCPGIEIHNFKFWQGKPSQQELICSGGIHAGLVIGDTKVSPDTLRFSDEVFSVYKDGELETSARASEIMGGPLLSLRWLAGFLARRGDQIKKGSWVIPGSPTELIAIKQDTVLKVDIEGVGQVSTPFKKP